MSEETQLTIIDGGGISLLPRNLQAQINDAIAMRDTLNQLFERLLEIKKDFDRIPGTDKPTLLKPGAEMLCKVFMLAQGKADVIDKSEDWERGIFSYTIGMPLIHMNTGVQVAYGIGAANSMEKKHRYRTVKNEQGEEVKIENPDPADLQNTLLKMANKRAFVDAVLKATGASRIFSQDMEDFAAMTGQYEKASSKQREFIKKMFGNMPEADAMTEISAIVGRDVVSYDDIHRSEASRIIDAKKGAGGGNRYGGGSYNNNQSAPPPPAGGGAPVADGTCADCGAAITKAEQGYSTTKFGRPLCRTHQTAAKASAAGA